MQNASLNLVADSALVDEPLSVADAKVYLAVDGTEHDAMIGLLIVAARRVAESVCHRELSVKTWRLSLDSFPPMPAWSPLYPLPYAERQYATSQASALAIPLLDPLISVDTFAYKAADGTSVTMVEDTDYIVDADKHPGIVVPPTDGSWPSADLWPSSAVTIEFHAGYTPKACPSEVKQGIAMLVAQWYDARVPFNDEKFKGELPFSVSALLGSDALYKF